MDKSGNNCINQSWIIAKLAISPKQPEQKFFRTSTQKICSLVWSIIIWIIRSQRRSSRVIALVTHVLRTEQLNYISPQLAWICTTHYLFKIPLLKATILLIMLFLRSGDKKVPRGAYFFLSLLFYEEKRVRARFLV